MPARSHLTNRSFAVAIFFVVLAVVVIGAAFWVLNRAQTPAPTTAPTPAKVPLPSATHVNSGKRSPPAATPQNDAGTLAKVPIDPQELKRRQHVWAQNMEALAAIRGGQDMPSFTEDLAEFDEVCAKIELALQHDLTPEQKQGMLEQLQSAFAALSEHDTRQAGDGEERLAAIDRAFRKMQVLTDAGELHRMPAAPDERKVQPAKSLVRRGF